MTDDKAKVINANVLKGAIPIQLPEIELQGNADAKILAKAFEEFSKDGLTKDERNKIEKLDDILKDADIVISKSGDKAAIAQEDGATFTIRPTGKGRSK